MSWSDFDGMPPEAAPIGCAVSVALVTCGACRKQMILKRNSVNGPYWWKPYGWHRLDGAGVDNGHKGRLYCPSCGNHIRESRSAENDG